MDPNWNCFKSHCYVHTMPSNLSRHAITSRTEEVMVSRAIVARSAYWWRASSDTRDDDGTVARYSDGVTLLLTGNAVSLDHGGTVRPRAGYELHEGGHAIKSLDTSRRTRYSFLQLHRNQPLELDARFRSRCKSCPVFIVGTVGVHGIRDYYVHATIIERRNRLVDETSCVTWDL